jgi:uncharacterized protein (DUF2147 family)
MIALMMAAALAGQGDVAGTWHTPARNGVVEISHCGSSICGRLVSSDGIRTQPGLKDAANKDASLRNRPLKGVQLLGGFKGGPQQWTGGTIYNPEDGGTYHAKVTLTGPNELKVQGCIVVPLCKTQTWTRGR